jgi:hypothetical protein
MRVRQGWLAYMSRADSFVLPHPDAARDKVCSLVHPSSNLSQKGQPVGHPTIKSCNLKGGTITK